MEYNFNQNLSITNWDIEIDTEAQYGYYQDTRWGCEGGLWFEDGELIDHDGQAVLPRPVEAALIRAGYKV